MEKDKKSAKWTEYEALIASLDRQIQELEDMGIDLELDRPNAMLKGIRFIQFDENGQPIIIVGQNKAKDFK